MRKLILAAAALTGIALIPTAHAGPLCWAWVLQEDTLVCELWGPSTNGQADAIARDAQSRNNADWEAARSTGTRSITSTTYMRYRAATRYYR